MEGFGQNGPLRLADQITLRKVSKNIADLTGFDTSALFTVTGEVAVRAYAVVGATAIQSTSGTTTVELGISGATALLIAQTTIDNSDFAANDVWVDTNPAESFGARPDTFQIIANGLDISLTRSVDDITQGEITVYLEWYPISDDGNIVAA